MFGRAGPFVGRRMDLLGRDDVGKRLLGLEPIALALSRELWQTYVAYAVLAHGFSAAALHPVVDRLDRRRAAVGVIVLLASPRPGRRSRGAPWY